MPGPINVIRPLPISSLPLTITMLRALPTNKIIQVRHTSPQRIRGKKVYGTTKPRKQNIHIKCNNKKSLGFLATQTRGSRKTMTLWPTDSRKKWNLPCLKGFSEGNTPSGSPNPFIASLSHARLVILRGTSPTTAKPQRLQLNPERVSSWLFHFRVIFPACFS